MQDDMKDFKPTSIRLIERLHEVARDTNSPALLTCYTLSVAKGEPYQMILHCYGTGFDDAVAHMAPYVVTDFAGHPAILCDWFGVKVYAYAFRVPEEVVV